MNKIFAALSESFAPLVISSSCFTSTPASTMWPQTTRASAKPSGSTPAWAARKYTTSISFLIVLVFHFLLLLQLCQNCMCLLMDRKTRFHSIIIKNVSLHINATTPSLKCDKK